MRMLRSPLRELGSKVEAVPVPSSRPENKNVPNKAIMSVMAKDFTF